MALGNTHRHEPGIDKALLIILLVIALRPILDLSGRLEDSASGVNLGAIVGVLVTVASLLTVLMSRRRSSGQRLTLLLLAFIALLLVIHAMTLQLGLLNLSAGIRALVALGPAPALLILTMQPRETVQRLSRAFLGVYLAATFVPVVVAVAQVLGVVPFQYFDVLADGTVVGRATGGYAQPNSLGRLMIVVVIWGWATLGNTRLAVTSAILGFGFLGLLVSSHRTSLLIGVMVVLIAVAATVSKERWRQRARVLGISTLLIAGVAALGLTIGTGFLRTPPPLSDYFADWGNAMIAGFETLSPDAADDGAFLRGRGWRWERTISLILDAPLDEQLLGRGEAKVESHNDLLHNILVFGVLGTAVIYGILLAFARVVLVSSQGHGRLLALLFFIAFALYAIPLHPTEYPSFMWHLMASSVLLNRGFR